MLMTLGTARYTHAAAAVGSWERGLRSGTQLGPRLGPGELHALQHGVEHDATSVPRTHLHPAKFFLPTTGPLTARSAELLLSDTLCASAG